MKCFVTGLTGFVGGYLASHLASLGAEVFGIGLDSQPDAPFTAVECDILDFDQLVGLTADFQPDSVYHLAALPNPSQSLKEPREYYRVNVQGTVNLLDALRKNQIDARILLISTSQVYGNSSPGVLLSEDAPLEPNNPYASSKRLSEEIALQYRKQFSSRVVITRPFNHTGPGQSEDFVLSDFCRQIALLELEAARSGKSDQKILVGNLKSTLDFLDVRDVVQAYSGLAEEGVEGEIYNICSGVGTEVSEILDTAIALAEVDIELEVSARKLDKKGEGWLVGNNQKLCSLLDWTPRYSLQQTITDTLNAWRVLLKNQPS
jgi:GDP-4-dehydro-6-deoxy-D-mannose reductase